MKMLLILGNTPPRHYLGLAQVLSDRYPTLTVRRVNEHPDNRWFAREADEEYAQLQSTRELDPDLWSHHHTYLQGRFLTRTLRGRHLDEVVAIAHGRDVKFGTDWRWITQRINQFAPVYAITPSVNGRSGGYLRICT